jgi:hypothetical protein
VIILVASPLSLKLATEICHSDVLETPSFGDRRTRDQDQRRGVLDRRAGTRRASAAREAQTHGACLGGVEARRVAATFPILPPGWLRMTSCGRAPTRREFFSLDLRGQIATIWTRTQTVRELATSRRCASASHTLMLPVHTSGNMGTMGTIGDRRGTTEGIMGGPSFRSRSSSPPLVRSEACKPNSPVLNSRTNRDDLDTGGRTGAMRGKPEVNEPEKGTQQPASVGGRPPARPPRPSARAAAWFRRSGLRPGFNADVVDGFLARIASPSHAPVLVGFR